CRSISIQLPAAMVSSSPVSGLGRSVTRKRCSEANGAPWRVEVTCQSAAHLSRVDLRRMSLTAGSRLGSYEVIAPIGAGGMGAVYRARDARLDREVAI